MQNATLHFDFPWFEFHSPWMLPPAFLVVLFSLLLVIGTSYVDFFFAGNDATTIHQLGGFSIVNAWNSFTKRYDFLRSTFDKTGHDLFSFKVFQESSECNPGKWLISY